MIPRYFCEENISRLYAYIENNYHTKFYLKSQDIDFYLLNIDQIRLHFCVELENNIVFFIYGRH
jgi:hypothetical protein